METENAIPGPSRTERVEPLLPAPEHPLPSTHFYSIEYPGYVESASVPLAISNLGGRRHVENAFKHATAKSQSLLELNFRPGNPFAHPVSGDIVSTSNVVLKVVKRRRKRRESDASDVPVGEYTAEAVGYIPKTVRFRNMVDFQYQPDVNDPMVKLRLAMDKMDVESILNFRIPEEKEDYVVPADPMHMDIDPALAGEGGPSEPKVKSNLRLIPPPLFSRQDIPHNYNYKANTSSIVTTVVDEQTGAEKKRLINRMRWRGFGPISIRFSDSTVPTKPSDKVEEQRVHADQKLLKRLQDLFAERPVWTRTAILNQFTPFEVREIVNSKYLLPLVSYVFEDGPWRDTQVRHGYDPRKDIDARFYQRLYFRNLNHPIVRPSVVGRRQEIRNETRAEAVIGGGSDPNSHIFDGVTTTKETAAFQLCDITDPMLKEMIEDDEDLRETPHERDGWYTTHHFEQIKTIVRHKFFSLLGGYIPSREECEALLVTQEGSSRPYSTVRKVRPGKNNMAKGALRPELVAAQRLQAALEQKAKAFRPG